MSDVKETAERISTERLCTELDRAQSGHRNMFSGAELVSLLTELLASRHAEAQEGGEVEPVAWHTIDIRGRMAEATDAPGIAQAWRDIGYTVRPLYAAPSNPVVSDAMVERAREAFDATWDAQNAAPVTDITPCWRAALTAALSVNPQSGSDTP